MTEDEAKTKWCPFSRVGDDTLTANNRPSSASYDCIASACMAWRWTISPQNAANYHPAQIEDGHCGLAGPKTYPST